MGILKENVPLSWPETKALSAHVQKHGVQQFINLYHESKDRHGDPFNWGDEMEYMLVKFDDEKKEAKVTCKSSELLKILHEKERLNISNGIWSPEFGAYLLESSPLKPYAGPFEHFKTVEDDIRRRREEVQKLLGKDECIMTLVNSLRFGCKAFTHPAYETRPEDPKSFGKSSYIPDEIIYSGHPRYLYITKNIQSRRGERLQTKVKVFKDENTKLPIEGSPMKEPDTIMLDTTFGCNLQVTVQGWDMWETRYLYDQLVPLCPLIQAITAAAPIYRGYLSELDNSYYVLGEGSDDRTAEERGLKPLKLDKYRINKLRWDSVDCYLTPEAEEYNDIHLHYDEKLYDHLIEEGIDAPMAQHVAHLFMRDPLLLFRDKVHQNDEEDTGHFDNLNTSTWQTLRFKPALPNTELGWRVEFRPCDVQLTDFENAAVSCFVILLTRAILYYKLNLLTPISKVDENMKTAEKRDACRKEKFWFRKNIMKSAKQVNGHISNATHSNGEINGHAYNGNGINGGDKDFELMTIDEIFNGKVSLQTFNLIV